MGNRVKELESEIVRIAVIGAGGFLGTAILKKLSGIDAEIIAVSSQVERLRKEFGDVGNIIVTSSLADITEKTDVLINCAFPRNSDGERMALGMEYICNVFCMAVEKNVCSVINISSQSVYDQKRKQAADEATALKLESAYAVGKYASELLVSSICKEISHTNIRLASLVGPGLEQRVLNKMIQQVIEGKTLYVKGGRQLFGYMDVRDAADAIVKVCLIAATGEQLEPVYNLGSEKNYMLRDIVDEIAVAAKERLAIPVNIIYEESKEMVNSTLVSEKFYKKFDWRPKISMKETISFLLEHRNFSGGVIRYSTCCIEKGKTA